MPSLTALHIWAAHGLMDQQQISNSLARLHAPLGHRVSTGPKARSAGGSNRVVAGMSRPTGGGRGDLEEEDGDPLQQEQSGDMEQLKLQLELLKERRLLQQAKAEVR